ncbi:MAG: hypothetical protein ACK5NK_16140 [Niabella sp.]
MKVRFLNRDKTITAATEDDIVTWMRTNDLERYRTNGEFMLAYAERKELFENIIIDSDNTTSFVDGLKKHKVISVFENKLFVSFRRSR